MPIFTDNGQIINEQFIFEEVCKEYVSGKGVAIRDGNTDEIVEIDSDCIAETLQYTHSDRVVNYFYNLHPITQNQIAKRVERFLTNTKLQYTCFKLTVRLP